MATLRSTESFLSDSINVQNGLKKTVSRISEGTRLVSSLSTKSMSYKEDEVLFSFESFMNITWTRVRVIVKLMKKGIIIHTINPVRINGSGIFKFYYFALIGEEATYGNIESLGCYVQGYINQILEDSEATTLFNDYKTKTTAELASLIKLNNYIRMFYSYAQSNRVRYITYEGAANGHMALFDEKTDSRYTAVESFLATCIHHSTYKLAHTQSLNMTSVSNSTVSYRVVLNEIVFIGKTLKSEPTSSSLVDKVSIFELPVVTGIEKIRMVNVFETEYRIRNYDLSLGDFAYDESAMEGGRYKSFGTDFNGGFVTTLAPPLSIPRDAQKFNVECFDGTIGQATNIGNGRYLVDISLSDVAEYFDDDDINDLRDEGYSNIIYIVDSYNSIDIGFRDYTFAFLGDRVRDLVMQTIAVSGIWNHFKVKY